MIAIAAAHMGYRVTVLDPDPDCPAAQVADDHIASPYEDRDAARELGNRSDVVTYEFENVDAGAADAAGELAPVYPSSRVLRTSQDRILEKASLNAAGFPVTPYRRVGSAEEFQSSHRGGRAACRPQDGAYGVRREGTGGDRVGSRR